MTQEVDLTIGATQHGDDVITQHLGLRTPFHTVCPFMLFEADGHSHTQRTYLEAHLTFPVDEDATEPNFRPIIDEMNIRMTPGQSRMKIPDEAVHVLRAYSTPTYTEFGALAVLAILRDTKHLWLPGDDRPVRARVTVTSIESIFANDILSTANKTI
jgi:GTP cyclohydrolase FolE2